MKGRLKKLLNAGTAGLLFQGTFVPLTSGTSANGQNLAGPLSTFLSPNGNLAGFFQSVFTLALALGAILAVLRLSYAGWLYMSSDAFGTKSHAKEVIQDAIIGLLLLIGIFIILNQINPNLLNLNILQTIQQNPSQQTQQTPAQQVASGTSPI